MQATDIFLSICPFAQSLSVINTFEGVQLTVLRPSAKEAETEGTSKLSLQKLQQLVNLTNLYVICM